MRVYDYMDKEGRIYAFEVSNLLVWRWGVIRIISKIPGVRITWRPGFTWFSPDVFVKFALEDVEFEASEDDGDNSRYWIGPNPARWVPQVQQVRTAFISARAWRYMG